jgi:histidine triad (HIT) family protein
MSPSACVFCRILAGELPSVTLLEAASHVAILDTAPVRPGHALVLSRAHVERMTDADPGLLGQMMATAQRLAPAILSATGQEAFNVVVNNGAAAGQVVFHLHLHVIPRARDDGFRWGWKKGAYAAGEMARVGEAIRAKL